jgi:hypothetical protein
MGRGRLFFVACLRTDGRLRIDGRTRFQLIDDFPGPDPLILFAPGDENASVGLVYQGPKTLDPAFEQGDVPVGFPSKVDDEPVDLFPNFP